MIIIFMLFADIMITFEVKLINDELSQIYDGNAHNHVDEESFMCYNQ